jgi:hypothetical protein
LQRDLAAGLGNAGPSITEPPPATPRLDALLLGAHHGTFRGLTQGRAPPPA